MGLCVEVFEKEDERNGRDGDRMILIEFWVALVVAVPVWIFFRRKRYRNWRRELLVSLFFVYGLGVLYLTLFPLGIMFGQERSFNTSLFTEMRWFIHQPFVGFVNIVGNIVMFMPLAMLVPLLDRRWDGFWRMAFFGLVCSLGIECLQYVLATRTADVDDLVLNTLGTMMGYRLFAAMREQVPKILRRT